MSEETTQEARPSDLVRDTLPDQEPATPQPGEQSGEVTRSLPTADDIIEAMKDVIDPELMVNVVDLGLVYGVQIDDEANVTIDMTLTSPTCPLTDRLEYDTQTVLEGIVNSVAINWVWLPPWGLERITEDGRAQLQAIGFNV
ncbi:metal-sulfur cluster assembly factor [Acidipropionibacterium jensenii]|uniref:metal-sulfur cluster assembly factor n=1 Tax=Acidipropionibacterium jensenii TaxID=1749 RepID=UPI00110B440B|nr:metal-sulfur cluster assembly factor [Acidipropionibacterium jensenii]QCV88543.1 metal-sulfur cluster assembly factor [Acidipropionibacterium jensenii]